MANQASIILKVLDQATGPLRRIARGFQTMGKQSRAALQQSAQVAAGLGAALAGGAAAGIAYAGKQSADLEAALGEVASVGVSKLDSLRQAALDFTNEWSGTSGPEFVRAAYDIKSGISSLSDEGVAGFTRLAGLTAKATKATTGEMTSLFATGYGIYREQFKELSDLEFGRVFSGGIAASVQAFKTTGPQMQRAVENLGATGTKALVPMQEQLAVMGMLQQTMSGSEAGTRYRALLKGVAKAGGELGLPFLDANKKIKSLPEILDLLRKKYGQTLDGMEAKEITTAFGSDEAMAVINLLIGQVDGLRGAAKNLGQQMKQGTAITEEMARKMNQGLGPGAARAGQRLANLGAVVGQALTPVLVPIMNTIGAAAVKMQAWAKENPGLARTVMIVAVALGGLVAVLGTLVAVMTAFNFAMLANPVTWIVAGIVAALAVLAVAGVWVVANWAKVKTWWKAFWDEYGNAVLVTLGIITGPLGWLAGVAGLIINNWEALKAFFADLWDSVLAAWDSGAWVDAGIALITGLWDGMQSLMGKVVDWLGDKVRGMFDWLPDSAKAVLGLKPAAAPRTSGEGRQDQQAPGHARTAQARAASAGEYTSPAPARPQAVTPAGAAMAARSYINDRAQAGPGPQTAVTPRQALGQPQKSKFEGKVVIEVNGPPGTRIRSAEQTGDEGIDLTAGVTVGMGY